MDTPKVNEPDPLWTDEEVAAYLRVEASTVRKWAKNGTIPVRKAGSLNRFDPAEIEAWTKRGKTDAGGAAGEDKVAA